MKEITLDDLDCLPTSEWLGSPPPTFHQDVINQNILSQGHCDVHTITVFVMEFQLYRKLKLKAPLNPNFSALKS